MAVPCRINDAPFSSCKERERRREIKRSGIFLYLGYLSHERGYFTLMFPLKDRLGRYETQVRSYATLPKKKLFLVSFATVHNRENFYREEGGKKGRSGEIYIYNITRN